mgnify:CR=1 FL=1
MAPVSLKISPSREPRKMTSATLLQVSPKPLLSIYGGGEKLNDCVALELADHKDQKCDNDQ